MRRLMHALLSLVLVLLAPVVAHSQNYLYGTGNQTWGINLPIENGFINVANGEVHLEIPIATLPQRGSIPLNESLVYDSRIWQIVALGSSYGFNPSVSIPGSMAGWRFVAGNTEGHAGHNTLGNVYLWNFTDLSGAVHLFNVITAAPSCNGCGYTATASGYALDGSGFYMSVTNYTNAVVYDQQGNQVAPTVVDRNGNNFSSDANGNLIDTLGRTPVAKSTSGNNIYYDVLTESGSTRRYTVTTETISVATGFRQSAVVDFSGSLTAIKSITLPNGSSYQFTYDSGTSGNYGELTGITLPTGGQISFGWSNYLDSYQNENRWLTSYYGGHGNFTLTPSVVTQCADSTKVGCQEQVAVYNEGNSSTVKYLLTLNNGAWNTQVTTFNSGSTTPVATTATAYNFSNSCTNPGICSGSIWATASSTTTTLGDTGQVAQTQYSYSYPWSGKPSSIKQWDYYTGTAPSLPTKETDLTYGTLINGAYFPTQINQLDSQGHLAAQTGLTYDQGTPQTASGATSLLAAPGGTARGNLTTLTRGTSNTVSTTATFDTAGQMLTSVDGNTHTTTYAYQCADAYLSSTTYPVVVNGSNLSSTASYDCTSGLINSAKDPNGVVNNLSTTYTYYPSSDPNFGALESVSTPDGGVTTYAYPSPSETDVTTAQTSSVSVVTKTILDQYGRYSQKVTTAPEGSITSETNYDLNGRPNCVVTSHLAGSTSSTDGKTCTNYDVLGRPTIIELPDSNSISFAYNGPSTTITDENGHNRKTTHDAFQRIKSILEPNASGALSFETDYLYDPLDNVQQVDQWGGAPGSSGDRQRLFSYNSLGQKIAENIPEKQSSTGPATLTCPGTASSARWTRCITYDGNGNVSKTTDNAGQTAQYTYDALNRINFITYSDGTPRASFGYDGNNESGTSLQNYGISAQNAIGHLSLDSNESNAGTAFGYDPAGRIKIESNYLPAIGTWSTIVSANYDLAGNLIALTYPDGRVVGQTYDSANRLTGVQYAKWGTTSIGTSYFATSSFDPPGQPTSSALGNGVGINAIFNSRQQVTSLQYASPSGVKGGKPYVGFLLWGKQYVWDKNATNLLTTIDQITGYGRQFTYDPLNRLLSATDIAVNNSGATKASGTVTLSGSEKTYENCTVVNGQRSNCNLVYDAGSVSVTLNERPLGTGYYNQGASTTIALIASSLVTSINANPNSPVVASYPGSGAVVTLTSINGGPTSNYSFSASTATADSQFFSSPSFTATASGATLTGGAGTPPAGGLSQTFSPDPFGNYVESDGHGFSNSFNSFNQMTSGYPYDARGNQTSDIYGHTLSFQSNGAIATVAGTAEKYVYDGMNQRVEVNGPTVTDYVYFGGRPIARFSGNAYTDLIYANGNLIAEVGGSQVAVPTYRVTDILGTLGGTLPNNTSIASPMDYAPFGQIFNGTTSDAYGFTGLEWDPTTATNHADFRQYSIQQNRWQSPDPDDGSYDWSDPQSLNRYAYVNGRPTVLTDPTGLDFGLGSIGGAGGCVGAVYEGGVDPLTDFSCGREIFNVVRDIARLFAPQFHGSLKPRPSTGAWNDRFGIPYGGLNGSIGGALGLPSGGCEFGSCGGGGMGFQQGGGGSDALSNYFSNTAAALIEAPFYLLRYGQLTKPSPPSAVCVQEAKTFQANFIKNAPHLRANGLFGGLSSVGSWAGAPGAAYLGYQTSQSQIDAAYSAALTSCTNAGR